MKRGLGRHRGRCTGGAFGLRSCKRTSGRTRHGRPATTVVAASPAGDLDHEPCNALATDPQQLRRSPQLACTASGKGNREF